MKRGKAAWGLWIGVHVLAMPVMIVTDILAAELKMPRIFSDNMVLQRNCQVPVWGWASPGVKISVECDGQVSAAVADVDGKWLVNLPAMPASTVPKTLSIMDATGNRCNYGNILIGDVWIASGQSNMELSFGSVERVPPGSSSTTIRLTGGFGSISPESGGNRFPANAWQECSPKALAPCSIAGYYFARELQQKLNIPIGLINMAVGCSSIESWMPPQAFAAHEPWKSELDDIKQMRELSQRKERKDGFSDSAKLQFMRDHAGTKYGKVISGFWMKNGEPMPDKFDFAFWHALVVRPANLYSHAVEPVVPFAIRGVIWYQGETNVLDQEYAEKQQALIESWRDMWNLGDFPFYTVQIAPFRFYPHLADCWLRQYRTAREVKNTGIVPTVDISDLDNCHPANKRDVGLRLAALALRDTYGSRQTIASGPIYRSSENVGGKMIVHFSQTQGGLRTRDGKAPDWFEIADAERKFVQADAVIAGDNVEVSSPRIPLPLYVRCGWNQVAEPNLGNSAGWPVWPFASDLPFFSEKREICVSP